MLAPRLGSTFRAVYCRLGKDLQRRFWRITLLAALVALAEFALTAAVSLLGVVLASPQTITQSRVMLRLIAFFPSLSPVTADHRLLLLVFLAGLCIAVFFKSLFLALATWRQASFCQAVNLKIGRRLFHGFVHAPYLWHVEQRVSDLAMFFSWRDGIGRYCFAFMQVLVQVAVAVLLLTSILLVTPLAGSGVLACTVLCAYAMFRLSRKLVNGFSRKLVLASCDSTRVTHAALYGVRELMLYRRQAPFEAHYTQYEEKIAQAQAFLPLCHPLPSWVLEWVGMVLLLGAIAFMYWQDAGVARAVGTLAMLAAVAWRLLPTMNRMAQQLLSMQQEIPRIEPVLRKLDEMAALPQLQPGIAKACPLHEGLWLEDVSFRYPSTAANKPDAVRHLNLCIPKGSQVGFVGPSGAGKSTIVGLLTGLFPPTSGRILVDGQPVDNALREGWIRRIGYVPQSPFLLNASIAENVAFSHWGEALDMNRVRECCHMAAMDFVKDLEHDIDTVIGERGVRLSGGQVQRVAIARALYNNPQFILFDEATSALDGAAEQSIQQTVNNLRGNMTLVVVAHRLSTVGSCDHIYWIEDGEVFMDGTPEKVLPAYRTYLDSKNCKAASVEA